MNYRSLLSREKSEIDFKILDNIYLAPMLKVIYKMCKTTDFLSFHYNLCVFLYHILYFFVKNAKFNV